MGGLGSRRASAGRHAERKAPGLESRGRWLRGPVRGRPVSLRAEPHPRARMGPAMVNVPKSVQPFWDEFQASIAYDASPRFYEAFHFDDNEPTANALAALVLSGQKRATAGLLWTNEVTSKPLPTVGSLSVVTDWQGVP